MLFTNKQYDDMYDLIYDWLAVHTPGSRCYISRLKCYQKNVWNPIIEMIQRLNNKEILDNIEKEFLDLVVYNGPIFRVQKYNSRYKGHICESEFYQSWSRSIDGVSSVSNLSGDVLLIVGQANEGIDLFGLLTFLIKNEYITPNSLKNPCVLAKYEKEKEVIYPVKFKNINEVVVVDKENIYNWKNCKKNISRDKWERNNMQ